MFSSGATPHDPNAAAYHAMLKRARDHINDLKSVEHGPASDAYFGPEYRDNVKREIAEWRKRLRKMELAQGPYRMYKQYAMRETDEEIRKREASHARLMAQAVEQSRMRPFLIAPPVDSYPPRGFVHPDTLFVDERNYYFPVEDSARQHAESAALRRAYEESLHPAHGGAGRLGGQKRSKQQRRKTPVRRRK